MPTSVDVVAAPTTLAVSITPGQQEDFQSQQLSPKLATTTKRRKRGRATVDPTALGRTSASRRRTTIDHTLGTTTQTEKEAEEQQSITILGTTTPAEKEEPGSGLRQQQFQKQSAPQSDMEVVQDANEACAITSTNQDADVAARSAIKKAKEDIPLRGQENKDEEDETRAEKEEPGSGLGQQFQKQSAPQSDMEVVQDANEACAIKSTNQDADVAARLPSKKRKKRTIAWSREQR